MKNFNICLVRPSDYIWSSVFSDFIDLLSHSLSDLGYSIQVGENHLEPKARNIIVGTYLLDMSAIDRIPPGTIFINTEQVGEGPDIWNQRIQYFVSRFPSWDYAPGNIDRFKFLGIREPLLMRIGYHPQLRRITPQKEYDIDVLFYGAINEDRAAILAQLEAAGLRVTSLFGVFGEERDRYIARSKLVLNLHQHQSKVFEILRVHYLMNNAKAVVAQHDEDSQMMPDYLDGIIAAPHNQIVDACLQIASCRATIQEYEQKAISTIKRMDAVAMMRDLLARTPES